MKKILIILALLTAYSAISSCSKYFNGSTDPSLLGTWTGKGTVRDDSGEILQRVTYTVSFSDSRVSIAIDNVAETYEYVSGVAAQGKKYFTVKTSQPYSLFYVIEGNSMNIVGSDTQSAIRSWPVVLTRYVAPQL